MNKQKYFETYTRKPDAWKVYLVTTCIYEFEFWWIVFTFFPVIKALHINYTVCIFVYYETTLNDQRF